MDDTAASMAQIAPFLWDLLDTLLLTRGKTTNVAASEGPEGEPGGDVPQAHNRCESLPR